MPEDFERRHGAFDAVVSAADPPVYLVTVAAGGERAGCLVGFASQVAIEPARFLVCLSTANHTYRVAAHADFAGVHLVGSDRPALAELFGSRTGDSVDKFGRCSWRDGPHGVPVLLDAAGWFCGRIVARHNFGDHLGLVLAPETGEGPHAALPSLRYRDVAELPPGHPA